MTNLGMNFNAEEHEQSEYTPVPAGKYPMMIVDSDVRDTQSGGKMAVFEAEILDGQYKGRKVRKMLNIQNSNAQAQEIALGQLSQMCKAMGKNAIKDTTELHNKRFLGDVVIRPAKGEYGPSNDIKKFYAFGAEVQKKTVAEDLDDEIPF